MKDLKRCHAGGVDRGGVYLFGRGSAAGPECAAPGGDTLRADVAGLAAVRVVRQT